MTEGNDLGKSSVTTFLDYRNTVHELLGDLEKLSAYARELGMSAKADQNRTVAERLAADKFTVAIVGEFKRGKSTFINALLGADALPTDVLPCSATLNRVTFGLQKRATLSMRDGSKRDVAFDELAAHITKLTEASEEAARNVETATVYYPSPYCKNNVDVIDTPGLNDDESMTDVTLGVLPHADAAIMVIHASSPFSQYESAFLEHRLLSADLGRVVFVVNGIDRLNTKADADRIVNLVGQRVKKHVLERARRQYGEGSPEYQGYLRKVGAVKVFGLSAYQALQAKLQHDDALLERSGFTQFEHELQRFLTEGRGAITLQVPLNRITAGARDIASALTSIHAALALRSEEFERAAKASEDDVAKLRASKAAELGRIDRLQQKLAAYAGTLAESFVAEFHATVTAVIDAAPITDAELSATEARKIFDQQIGKSVANAAAAVVDRYSGQLDAQIKQSLVTAASAISSYDQAVSGLMERIANRLQGLSDKQAEESSIKASTYVIGGVMPLVGGVMAASQEHGVKGGAVGAAATVGTVFVGVLAAALIGVPVGIPLTAALGVASVFSGRWASDKLFSKSRIENYRTKLRDEALLRLAADFSLERMSEQFQRTADQALSRFRQQIDENTDVLLRDATATLVKLREEYASGRVRTQAELLAASQMQQELTRILERSARLAGELDKVALQ